MIKFFKKGKKFEKQDLSPDIQFYWNLAVCFMFTMIVVSLFLGYFLYRQINRESVVTAGTSTVPTKTVDTERIDKVLEYFSIRAEKSNDILNSPSPIIDPSL